MNAPQEPKDFRAMTATTIGKDLLSALVAEIKLMPDVWPKLPETKQNDIIDRLRMRVDHNVKMAVHLIATEGQVSVLGALDSVTIKNGGKAVVKFSRGTENLLDLCDSEGQPVLIVVSSSHQYIGGMDEVCGESDQRGLDLGHEYHENDGGGMDSVDDGKTIDAEALGLPSPEDVTPTQEDLDKAWNEGYAAAEDGKPESDCPVMRGALCIAWVKGYKAWHEENPKDVG